MMIPSDEHGFEALIDRIFSKGGADGSLFEDFHGSGQGAGPQHDGQVLGVIHGEGTGDLGFSAGDLVPDHGSRVDFVIQNNRQPLSDVIPGDPLKNSCPPGIKGEGNIGLAHLIVELDPGIGNGFSGEGRSLLEKIGNIRFPACLPIHGSLLKDFASCRHVAFQSLLETVFLIHQLEFQACGLADEIDGSLGIFDTRELDENSVSGLGTDVRLSDSELIDAVPDGFKGLIRGHLIDLSSFLFDQARESRPGLFRLSHRFPV